MDFSSILSSLGGGGISGAKDAMQQQSLLQMLGLAPTQQYDSPIGAMPNGAPMPSSMIDPATQAQQRSSSLANLGSKLNQWGAGVSAASAPSRMPVDFGQALAGGTQALQQGQDRELDTRLKEAQIGALGAKGQPDFEAQAQQALIKRNMGIGLSPQEEAALKAYDQLQTSKLQTVTMPDSSIRQVPAYRPVFADVQQGQPARQQIRQRPPLSSFMR
jgi:hypothetical protein